MRCVTGWLVLLSIIATMSTCDSGEKSCPEGQTKCDDGECHQCCINDDCSGKLADCPQDFTACSNDYMCECICLDEGEDCSGNLDVCCADLNCEMGTCMPLCTTDNDCRWRYPNDPYWSALSCKNGICQYLRCDDNMDCPGGRLCLEGYCVRCDCPEIDECIVLPSVAVTRQGATARFAAAAYLTSGAVAPGITFSWESSDSVIATVDDTGLVTGSTDSGTAIITASILGCCDPVCDAAVFNYGLMPGGSTRVVAVDELSEIPIEGATVTLGNEVPVLTDANGVAEIAVELNASNPQDITISKQDYDYVTLKVVQTNDVLVHLSPLHHLDFTQDPPAKGTFSFDMIRCEPPLQTCDVSLALAGLSIPPSLTNLGLDMLADGVIMTEVQLGGNTELMPFAPGFVWCLSQTCFKEYYTPEGIPGNRLAWGLGGKADLSELIDIIGPMISSGKFDTLDLFLEMGPTLGSFYTSMVPNVEIVPRPMVVDINDIDGDPATSEVPDYDNFPLQYMTLKIGMDQEMTFNTPALPVGVYDGVVLIGGVIVRGAGFVPLGLAVGKDAKDGGEIPDGVIEDPIVLNVADVAGRIPEEQVHRTVLALAVKLADEGGPGRRAVQIMFVDSFAGTHDLPAFLLPVEATYDPQARNLEIVHVPDGVDFLQAVFSGEDDSGWHVFTEDFSSFDLPAAPAEGDRADSAGIYAVNLGMGGYQDLVEFNDTNLGNLIEITTSFSEVEVPLR